MTDETWGPWIEHDGKGCPCRGAFVHLIYDRIPEATTIAGSHPKFDATNGGSWNWENALPLIIRYRIRKPRALLDLIERAREIDDAPEGPVRAPAKRVPA